MKRLFVMWHTQKEETSVTKLAQLELKYQSLPAQAHEYALACIALPTGAILIALSRVNSLLSCLRKPHLYENVGYGDERGGDERLEDERNDHDEDQGGEIQG